MSEILYRIEFSIQRRKESDEDFTEIGFGSSCGDSTIAGALYEVQSVVDNWQWETQPGMPDPDEIRAETTLV